jgi:hypothetical protein
VGGARGGGLSKVEGEVTGKEEEIQRATRAVQLQIKLLIGSPKLLRCTLRYCSRNKQGG